MKTMEDNTGYIAEHIWQKIQPPALVSNLFIFVTLQLGMFFLLSRFCPKNDLVVYSAFLPFWLFAEMGISFFAMAAPQYFSIFKGAGDHPRAQQVFSECLTMYMLFAVVCGLFGFFAMPAIVDFLNLPDELKPLAIRYGRLMTFAMLGEISVSMLATFIRSDSLPKQGAVITIVTLSSFLISIAVSLCIFHNGVISVIVLQMGEQILSVVCYLGLIVAKRTTIRLRWKWVSRDVLKNIFALSCGSIMLSLTNFVVELLLVRWIILCFGAGIVTLSGLLNLLLCGSDAVQRSYIASAQSLVSVFRGEKNHQGIRLACRKGILRGMREFFFLALLLFIFADYFQLWIPVLENFSGETAWMVRIVALSLLVRYPACYFASIYNVCGFSQMVVIWSLLGNGLLYLLEVMIFCFVIKNEKFFWLYQLIVWGVNAVTLWVAVLIMKRRGNYDNMLLIRDETKPNPVYHFLLQGDTEEFSDYWTMLAVFLKKNGATSAAQERCRHIFEELFLFSSQEMKKNKEHLFSIVTAVLPDSIQLDMRCDSKDSRFDAILSGHCAGIDPTRYPGVQLLRKLSDEFYFDRIYGFNYIRISVNNSVKSEKGTIGCAL